MRRDVEQGHRTSILPAVVGSPRPPLPLAPVLLVSSFAYISLLHHSTAYCSWPRVDLKNGQVASSAPRRAARLCKNA